MLTFTLISAHATSIKHLTEIHDVVGLSNSIADYMGGYGDQTEGEGVQFDDCDSPVTRILVII